MGSRKALICSLFCCTYRKYGLIHSDLQRGDWENPAVKMQCWNVSCCAAHGPIPLGCEDPGFKTCPGDCGQWIPKYFQPMSTIRFLCQKRCWRLKCSDLWAFFPSLQGTIRRIIIENPDQVRKLCWTSLCSSTGMSNTEGTQLTPLRLRGGIRRGWKHCRMATQAPTSQQLNLY